MSNFMSLLQEQAISILEKTLQQSCLALIALFIAMLISIPIGILIAKKTRLKNFILATNGVIQTLPSLALLGILLPVFGIGVKTSLIAIILYALLPIMRNTVAGVLAISPELIEAAKSLGLTRYQRIKLIELPLAMPLIVAGIRTATAMAIGIATLAALIGAGGLGDFIYEGLALNNINMILMGAIPAALLALFFDFVIGRVEHLLTHRHLIATKNRVRYISYAAVGTVAMALLIFFLVPIIPDTKNQVRVGSKNFSEQLILGELIAQLLEDQTKLEVKRTFNLGGTFICHRAILNNEIDVYPEYTGTSYSVILNKTGLTDPKEIYNYVSDTYLARFNLVWLDEFGFNNSNALAITAELAKKYDINTIDELVRYAPKLTIGVPADFMKRPDGFVGLKSNYHLEFDQVKLMDAGLMYKAIAAKEIDAIMAFSTDARLKSYNLVTLVDNKKLFPPYYAAPVVRKEFLKHHPEISKILKELGNKIDNQTMQALNYQVDIAHRSPREVAHEFLQHHHLLK